ncbi:hypothetical protein AB3S75_040033 [Citrus x aurantiifolia]
MVNLLNRLSIFFSLTLPFFCPLPQILFLSHVSHHLALKSLISVQDFCTKHIKSEATIPNTANNEPNPSQGCCHPEQLNTSDFVVFHFRVKDMVKDVIFTLVLLVVTIENAITIRGLCFGLNCLGYVK